MNEVIKQLATQAGMEDYPTYGVNALYGEATIEKFAELIVQECLAVTGNSGDSEWDSYSRYDANMIKEHFGIK